MAEYAQRVRSFDENESFFEEHPQLLSEHAMGYLLMEALQLGMDNKLVRCALCACCGACAQVLCAGGHEACRASEVPLEVASGLCRSE